NTVALALSDIVIALTIHADRGGAHDRSLRGSLPRPGSLLLAGAGEGGDDAGLQIQTSDPLVLNVRDEQSASTVQEAIVWLAQLGADSRAAVASVAWFAAGERR